LIYIYITNNNEINYAVLADCEYRDGNINKAKEYYMLSTNQGNYLSYIKIGDIYNYNWENRKAAKYYYLAFIKKYINDPDRYKYFKIYNSCLNKLEELSQYDKINETPNVDLEDLNVYMTRVLNEREFYPVDIIVADNEITNHEEPELDFIEYEFNEDDQNVHDVYVNKSSANSINALKANTVYKYDSDSVYNLLLSKDESIKYILDKIRSCHVKNSYNELTNNELLVLIVNRIEDYNNTDKINAYNFLITNIKECDENGKIVCHTGINNRLIQSLSIVDKSVSIKNKELYQQEMLNTAARLRDQHGDENLKDILMLELKKIYIDTNILNQHQLDDIIKDWIDYI